MTEQELKEYIAEVKYSDIPKKAKKMIANLLYEQLNRKKDNWIPCSEKLPETDTYILLSFKNASIPEIGRYETDSEGGAFYLGDSDRSCVSYGLFVNAWQPLPENYREDEDE